MTTNNDTAAILAALDAAGLEIPELEFESDGGDDHYAKSAHGAYMFNYIYSVAFCRNTSIRFAKISSADCYDSAIAAANAHNRELVAGMLRVKDAK